MGRHKTKLKFDWLLLSVSSSVIGRHSFKQKSMIGRAELVASYIPGVDGLMLREDLLYKLSE